MGWGDEINASLRIVIRRREDKLKEGGRREFCQTDLHNRYQVYSVSLGAFNRGLQWVGWVGSRIF